jgi:hypothetical protein
LIENLQGIRIAKARFLDRAWQTTMLATIGFDSLDQLIPSVYLTPPNEFVWAVEHQRAERNQPENTDAEPNQKQFHD